MSIITAPLQSPDFDQNWIHYFAVISPIIASLADSGTSSTRPSVGLWVGRQYFDTTLGLPIYVKSLTPTVWVNAAGAVV